jgi:hypothetical protein
MTIGVTRAVSLAIGAIAPTITIVNQSVSTTAAVARQIFSGIANSIRAASSLFGRVTIYVCHSLANTVTNTYQRVFGLRAPVRAPVDRDFVAAVVKIIRYVDREYSNRPLNEKIALLEMKIQKDQESITELEVYLAAVDESRSRDDQGVAFFALAKRTVNYELDRIIDSIAAAEGSYTLLCDQIRFMTMINREFIRGEFLNELLAKRKAVTAYLVEAKKTRDVLKDALIADLEDPTLNQGTLRSNKGIVCRAFLEIIQCNREKLERLKINKLHLIYAKGHFDRLAVNQGMAT